MCASRGLDTRGPPEALRQRYRDDVVYMHQVRFRVAFVFFFGWVRLEGGGVCMGLSPFLLSQLARPPPPPTPTNPPSLNTTTTQQLKLAKNGTTTTTTTTALSSSSPSSSATAAAAAAALAKPKKQRKWMDLTIHGQGMRPEKFTAAGA